MKLIDLRRPRPPESAKRYAALALGCFDRTDLRRRRQQDEQRGPAQRPSAVLSPGSTIAPSTPATRRPVSGARDLNHRARARDQPA